MQSLLACSRWIDAINDRLGRAAAWLVLLAVLVSAGNAIMRKAFSITSNAFLEAQWYLFGATIMLCGAYTLLRQEHVRIDIVYARFSRRTQVGIDIFGTLFFLLPFAVLMAWLSWPYFLGAWQSGEQSANAGGLLLWPVKLLLPLGFALLVAQGVSELIKRVAFLAGAGPDPGAAHDRAVEVEASIAMASAVKQP